MLLLFVDVLKKNPYLVCIIFLQTFTILILFTLSDIYGKFL